MNRNEFFTYIREKRTHVSVQELIKLLIGFGFAVRRTSKNHYIAQFQNRIISFPPPHPGKHVKKPYVNEVIKVIEDLRKETGGEE